MGRMGETIRHKLNQLLRALKSLNLKTDAFRIFFTEFFTILTFGRCVSYSAS